MKSLNADEIVILLGAGASVETGIPHSARMIYTLEDYILHDPEWSRFRDLYHYIRSSIYYSEGIHGRFEKQVNYNIERLVDTLNEISMKNKHTLYPFVGSWNPTLIEVAGNGFVRVEELKKAIVQELMTNWLAVTSYRDTAAYYEGLIQFQHEYNFPLRIFTLNYDLCVEKICERYDPKIHVERGFNHSRQWDWRQFEDNPLLDVNFYLYKMHGSIDWIWKDETLTYQDDRSPNEDNTAIIFGTSYKLEYRDPFLFFAYEFRKWTLEAKIILVIGYGFGDEHINKIIQQALNNSRDRVLLVITPLFGQKSEAEAKNEIALLLSHGNPNQIVVSDMKASEFMTQKLNLDYVAGLLSDDDVSLIRPTSSQDNGADSIPNN